MDVLLSEQKLVLSSGNREKANALCEAGLEEVLWEYNYGGADFTGGGWSGVGIRLKTVSSFSDTFGNALGSYTASVEAWNTAAPIVTVTATPLSFAGLAVPSTLKAKLKPRPLYSGAVKADGAVIISGSAWTDSYNSTAGPYGGANIAQNGHVFTNSGSVNAITLGSGSSIQGNATTGTGGTVSNPSSVTGSISTFSGESLDTNTVPAVLTALPNMGSLSSTQTVPTGSYKYTELSIGGGNIITIDGDVTLYLTGSSTSMDSGGSGELRLNPGASLTIYADGNITLSSNSVLNASGTTDPSALTIYGTSTCSSVTLSGNSALAALVNTPQANISISGSGGIYGAVISDTFTSGGNGGIHFDENLLTNGPTNGYKLDWYHKV